jgi:hypothetical protein
VVAAPLAVLVGLNVPQEEALQVTDHVTPPLFGSFVTTAVSGAVAPGASDAGGAGVRVTVSAGALTFTVTEADTEVFVTDVAVTVTLVGPEGAV